jgi:hypothetical protein
MSSSSSNRPWAAWRETATLVAVAILAAAFALPIYRQGLNFLDDGVWLLGAQALAEGKTLYRDFFTIYGPARFVALAATFAITGTSALSLAILESLSLGVATSVGFWATRRLGAGRWSWLVPLGMLALGPLKLKLVAVAVLAILFGWRLRRPLDIRSALLFGVGWGVLSWFGFDAFVQAVVICAGTLALTRTRLPRALALSFVGAFVLAGSVVFVWAAATGSLNTFVWDTIIYPLLHFRHEMGVSVVATLTDATELGMPFAGLTTGESLDPFLPAHSLWRVASVWTLAGMIFFLPAYILWKERLRPQDSLLAAMVAFALASWIPLVGRGDMSHLLAAAAATIWLAPTCIRWLRRSVPRIAVGLSVALLALGPILAENLWLATHSQRDGLLSWDRDRALVKLPSSRIQELESTIDLLPGAPHDPALFWPAQPGLHFVFDIPTAVPQVTLLGGEVRNPEALVAELRRTRPPRVVLSARWKLQGRDTRELCPEVWDYFRSNYRIHRTVADTADPFFILVPIVGGDDALRQLPVSERLFDRRQNVANSLSPSLGPGVRVGQSLQVGALNLSGIRVRWLAERGGFAIPVQLVLWDFENGRLGQPFQGYRAEVVFEEREKVSEFQFDPPVATADRQIAITFEFPEESSRSIRLFWHQDPANADFYDEGTALVDGEAVDADLYFTTY